MPDQSEIDNYFQKINREAEANGYHLNPDKGFTLALVEGLLINTERFGYPSCPCRLSTGKKEEDLDLICPCDYRDPDLTDFDMCFCGLYVSSKVVKGEKKTGSIPERRPRKEQRSKMEPEKRSLSQLPLPVWRCKVCGYLCARENPPETCPICKVTKERFERFM